MRRAAFGAPPSEIERIVALGLEGTVDELLDSQAPDPALDARLAQFDLTRPVGIVQWWLTRMVFSRHQLQERMTFFLHDHFATSIQKVNRPDLMLGQNNLFRTHAFGNFTELATAVSRDPAMLIWLDNYTNVSAHPNENYARELLELFTLGHHVYTEDDVIAAARAFTGWSLDRNTLDFRFYPALHDFGTKTFLGETGALDGGDIIRIACAHDHHGHFLAEKLFHYFVREDPEAGTIDQLAMIYHDAGTELTPLVRAILTSEEMFSEKSFRAQTKSPVEHAVIAARLLEIEVDVTRAMVDALSRQNQIPFVPPAVDGWTSGLDWINSNTLLSRMSLGRWYGAFAPPEPLAQGSADAVVDAWLQRLDLSDLPEPSRTELVAFCESWAGTNDSALHGALVQMIISLPEWQLN